MIEVPAGDRPFRRQLAEADPELCPTAIDYVQLCVRNVDAAVEFYARTFGFRPSPSEILPGGRFERSALMTSGRARIVLTEPATTGGAVAEHLRRHGEGVCDVALRIPNVERALRRAVEVGATVVGDVTAEQWGGRLVTRACVRFRGGIVHTLIERDEGDWVQPEFNTTPPSRMAAITRIDHVALCVPAGMLDRQVAFYVDAFGMRLSHEEYVATEFSSMNSKAVESANGHVKIPVAEPAPGPRISQVQAFLERNGGSGIQHVALLSEDIVGTIQALEAHGIDLLPIPGQYYEQLRAGQSAEGVDLDLIRRRGILIDSDEWGHLLQAFTKPVSNGSALFFEIIQRQGARGFGSGNIKALFKAVEHEQLTADRSLSAQNDSDARRRDSPAE